MGFSIPNLTPYGLYIKLAGVAVLAAFLFVGGCRYGVNSQVDEISGVKQELTKTQAERDGAANALNEVNRQARFREEQAVKDRAAAKAAGEVAVRAEAELRKRTARYSRDLDRAHRNPTCAALLDADLKKVCGL